MKIKGFAVAVAALLGLAMTGCEGGGEPGPAAASPSASASSAAAAPTSAAAAEAVDPAAKEACAANEAAQAAGTMDDPEVMAPIAKRAQESSIEDIRFQGALMDERVEMARAAAGASDEVAMQAHLVANSFKLLTACVEAGYRP